MLVGDFRFSYRRKWRYCFSGLWHAECGDRIFPRNIGPTYESTEHHNPERQWSWSVLQFLVGDTSRLHLSLPIILEVFCKSILMDAECHTLRGLARRKVSKELLAWIIGPSGIRIREPQNRLWNDSALSISDSNSDRIFVFKNRIFISSLQSLHIVADLVRWNKSQMFPSKPFPS